MTSRGFWETAKRAARAEPGFVLLTVVGVIVGAGQVFFSLPDAAEGLLFVVGSVATLLGAAGFGTAIGQGRTDEMLRLKLEPLYRRTIDLYEAISLASWELGQGYAEVLDATKPSGLVDARIVRRRTERVDVTLQLQTKTFDRALDEWRELLPERADETAKRLRREGRLS